MPESWLANLKARINILMAASPSGFRRYFFNAGWLLGGQAVSLGVSFLVSAWIVRSLGPEDYGIFSFSLSFAGLFSMIAGLGIDGILARDLVRYPERLNRLLGSGLVIKVTTGALAWLAATLSAWLILPAGSGRVVVSLIALSYFFYSLNIIDILFRSRVESRFGVRSQVVAIIISSIFKIWVVTSGASLAWLAAAYSSEILFFGLALILSYRARRLSFSAWQVDRATIYYLISSSWPLLFSGMASFFLLRIDQVMIRYYQSAEAVGWYAAGVKLVEVWYFIPGLISVALFPAVINSQLSDYVVYRRRIRYFYLLLGLIALLISLSLTLATRPLILWLFGEQFLPAVLPTIIYAWSTIGWFLSSALWIYLMAENRLKLIFVSSLGPLVINVLLNMWLIPRYSISGAALATFIAYSSIIIFIIYSQVYENTASHD